MFGRGAAEGWGSLQRVIRCMTMGGMSEWGTLPFLCCISVAISFEYLQRGMLIFVEPTSAAPNLCVAIIACV
ncbi:hypothetical protein I7I48_11651 [Histoplasma ohiense]|nr:hypothetical protein I7I48_11651 [Histoplasma ohiense (nom. inval.)]